MKKFKWCWEWLTKYLRSFSRGRWSAAYCTIIKTNQQLSFFFFPRCYTKTKLCCRVDCIYIFNLRIFTSTKVHNYYPFIQVSLWGKKIGKNMKENPRLSGNRLVIQRLKYDSVFKHKPPAYSVGLHGNRSFWISLIVWVNNLQHVA